MALAPQALAETITVTGNGAESENEVVVSNDTQTDVQQSNDANITNNISTSSNTGGNTASGNTDGNTVIRTGDAVQQTEVKNEVNHSVVEQNNCCQSSNTNITVSNNGAFSYNEANVRSSNTTNVNVYQNANVVNNIDTYANTGNNKASYNTDGDTVIKTGDIAAIHKVKNGPINLSYISLPAAQNSKSQYLAIFGNGFGSWNTIDLDEANETSINVVNVANVLNDLKQNYSTGDNKAKFNTDGDTAILTGDIAAYTIIDNGPINVSKVKIDCECEKEREKKKEKEKEKEKEEAPVAPAAPVSAPPSAPNISAPAPVAHAAEAAVSGPQLPVTGNNWIVLALFGNIMMLLLGAYLRLRSGRSPGFELA